MSETSKVRELDPAAGRVYDADGINATVDATYSWTWGEQEQVTVWRIHDGRAFVSWRENDRLDSWEDLDRLTMPRAYSVSSPSRVPHLIVNGHCSTCGLTHDWLTS